jgi:hypothetical protein
VKEVSDACEAEKKTQDSIKLLQARGYVWLDGKWQKPEAA